MRHAGLYFPKNDLSAADSRVTFAARSLVVRRLAVKLWEHARHPESRGAFCAKLSINWRWTMLGWNYDALLGL